MSCIHCDVLLTVHFPRVLSWYNDANIPGKVREDVPFTGGVPLNSMQIADRAKNGYKGFTIL
jgi:hypothetical protein